MTFPTRSLTLLAAGAALTLSACASYSTINIDGQDYRMRQHDIAPAGP